MKKLTTALGVLGLTVASSAIVAAPAHADIYSCQTNTVCVYTSILFGGAKDWGNGSWSHATLGIAHDKGKSWINANNSQRIVLGDYVNGRATDLDVLSAGWTNNQLPTWAQNRSDYYAHR